MSTSEIDNEKKDVDTSRRSFLKLGLVGAGAAAATAAGVTVVKRM